MLHSLTDVPYQQHYHSEVNLFCIFQLYNAVWNNLVGENSSNSRKIFTLQKKISSIMVVAHTRTPCRSLS